MDAVRRAALFQAHKNLVNVFRWSPINLLDMGSSEFNGLQRTKFISKLLDCSLDFERDAC